MALGISQINTEKFRAALARCYRLKKCGGDHKVSNETNETSDIFSLAIGRELTFEERSR